MGPTQVCRPLFHIALQLPHTDDLFDCEEPLDGDPGSRTVPRVKKCDKGYAAVDDAIKFSSPPSVVLYGVTPSMVQFKLQ